MIYGLVLTVHILVCFLLIVVILLQGGRGGLAEAMGGAAAQSLFGGGANVVMSRITAIGACLFMVTCLSLAMLSTQRGRSVIDRMPVALPDTTIPLSPGAAPTPLPEAAPPATSSESESPSQ